MGADVITLSPVVTAQLTARMRQASAAKATFDVASATFQQYLAGLLAGLDVDPARLLSFDEEHGELVLKPVGEPTQADEDGPAPTAPGAPQEQVQQRDHAEPDDELARPENEEP